MGVTGREWSGTTSLDPVAPIGYSVWGRGKEDQMWEEGRFIHVKRGVGRLDGRRRRRQYD